MKLAARAGSLVLGAVLGASSCSPAPDGTSAPARSTAPARSAAPASVPRAVLPSGTVITLDLAVTDQERTQGLMFRESMPQKSGMVFLFEGLEIRSFWMKNCHFPLDMIYTLSDGMVVDVLSSVPPCPADPCPSYPPREKADTVVEVNAGVAGRNGVVPGARLVFKDVPGR